MPIMANETMERENRFFPSRVEKILRAIYSSVLIRDTLVMILRKGSEKFYGAKPGDG